MERSQKIRRICFYGAPHAGKSTVAAYVFTALKDKGYEVESVSEYVKNWTFINRKPESFDQVYLLAKQMHAEDIVLRTGVDYIVTDCPLLLPCFYAYDILMPGWTALAKLAHEFEKQFKSLNIYLRVSTDSYNAKSRFHSYKEALRIDEKMFNYLQSGQLQEFHHDQKDDIIDFIRSNIHSTDVCATKAPT